MLTRNCNIAAKRLLDRMTGAYALDEISGLGLAWFLGEYKVHKASNQNLSLRCRVVLSSNCTLYSLQPSILHLHLGTGSSSGKVFF